MANIDFSKSGQDKALEFIGKDMLVSASAGSGKTTVMVEKILRYLETGSVTRIIVLTFTKASAQDMKEKLTERLLREIRLGGERAEHYKRELQLLPFAYIGTIDAICGEIYKRYFEEIGVSPGLEILDDEEGKALLNTAIEQVIEKSIKEGEASFNELGTLFSDGKSFEKLKEPINEIISFISAQENPSVFMAYALEEAEKPLIESTVIKDTVARFRKKFSLFTDATEALIADAKTYAPPKSYERCYQKAVELNDLVWDIIHADDQAFIERIIAIDKFMTVPSSTKGEAEYLEYLARVKKVNEAIKGLVAKAQKIFTIDLTECEREDADSRRLAKMLLETVVKVRQKYSELKEEEGKADFEDVERYALQILSHKSLAKEFSEGIDYIFLDEYQDTNRLQEAIFDKIARGNLFMVGDVKQAIYGFREADPDIFLEKHRKFKEGDGGKNVPLNKNFRSDQRVLKFVDDVFSEVMTYDFGGIDYRRESRFGEAGLANNSNGDSPEVEVAVFTPERKESEVPEGIYSVKEGARSQIEFKKEDYYIASKIKELVGKQTVYDKSMGGERLLRYSDVAILYRYKRGAEGTRKVLDKYGIPYVAEGFEGERDMRDINAINAFMKVLDNPKEDLALAGAMLSPIGGFSESELAEIRNQNLKEPFFHRAVTLYQGRLTDKITAFNDMVKKYRKTSALVDVTKLIGIVMTESGYLSKLMASGQTKRIETYNAYVHAIASKKFATTLTDYVEFLSSGVELKIPEPVVAGDAVRIMTVHKSKGLEFPVVFMARSSTPPNNMIKTDSLALDARYGVGINCFNREEGSVEKSTRRRAIEEAVVVKQNLEALRLMYVAATRARYKLYVSGESKMEEFTEYERPDQFYSFLDWILYARSCNPLIPCVVDPIVEIEDAPVERLQERLPLGGSALTFEVYPHFEATTLSNKYTVTALNRDSEEKPHYIPTLGTQTIEKGIAYHKVMELIDFNLADLGSVKAFVEGLERDGVIEQGIVDASLVMRALAHPLMDYARHGKCLREQEFIYYAPACEVLAGAMSTDRTLVQGVMDLVVLGEQNVLIDYKVSSSPTEALRERYRTQLDLYARAFEASSGQKLHRKAVFVLNRGEIIEF